MDDRVAVALRALVSVSLLVAVVWLSGPAEVVSELGRTDPGLFALALCLGVLGVAVSAKKWQLLLRAKGEPKPFRTVFAVYYVGTFVNLVLPSTIGGDAVKAYNMSKDVASGVEAYSSVFMERFTGLVALLTWATLGALLAPELLSGRILLLLGAMVAGTVALALLLFLDVGGGGRLDPLLDRLPLDAGDRLQRLSGSIRQYRGERGTIGAVLAISLAFHVIPIVNHYVLARALGIELPVLFLFVVIPVTHVLLFVPVSIQGYGVREVLYAAFLAEVGVALPQAVALAVLVEVFELVKSSFGAIPLARS